MSPDDTLKRLAATFEHAGKRLYLVGGPVRDMLLNRPIHDYDLTTDALPDETRHLLRRAGAQNLYGIGEKFGTIGAEYDDHTVEITTFRGEQYTPGSRKPEVTFGTSLENDLARRDFTINAMALDAENNIIIDPFGGQDDLEKELIRAVGAPAARFAEDPLRLLRAVRFATVLEFQIDPATASAIHEQASMLATISKERIADEMHKLLLSREPSIGLRLLVDLDLMPHIIPEMMAMVEMGRNQTARHKNVFDHVMQVVDKSPHDLTLRWAALLHDIAKPATYSVVDGDVHFFGHEILGARMSRDILSRLRQDRGLIDRVTSLVAKHMRINTYSDWSDGAVRRFMREAGDQIDDLFALSRADITSHRFSRVQAVLANVADLEARVQQLEEEAETAKLHSPLDGHALMTLFARGPGPWLGAVKTHLLDLVLDGELDQDDVENAKVHATAYMEAHPEL